MKYTILLIVLLCSFHGNEKSAWEIHYLVSTTTVNDNIGMSDLFSQKDSTVVKIMASDSIKRYHYTPGGSDIQRIYYLTEKKDILIDPLNFKPIERPVGIDRNYAVDWNSIIKKTGKTKMILGFECAEYSGSTIVGQPGREIDSFSRFWILELAKEKKRKLRPQYYLKKGIVLEKENIVKSMALDNEIVYSMKATSIKRLEN